MLNIPKKIYEEMIAHAKKCYPQEACGFVAGKQSAVQYFIPMENIDHSTITYTMDPKQQLKAFRKIDGDKLDLLGIFHSHVASEAYPSQTDRKMAFYPEVSYLIVSLADLDRPDLKSFRISDDQVTREDLKIQ